MSDQSLKPVALTVNRATAYSGLSRSRLYELVKAKKIAAFKISGRTMFLTTEIDRFIYEAAAG
ncbi:helix-turn-helix domain-containing protein [uncultured Brevundimonas sp.]|uniref:helix-turn-helix domain-containing protein n=1 Tax=uncultured Brevundimonas sp. TaxID=213418 RepID=UPI00263620A9|nr:helix-turn-helix domain-containing protein [uncultured Brevundimonas sp.]